MRFDVCSEIYPSGLFGIPQKSMIVLPVNYEYKYEFMELVSGTVVQVGLGTVSKYREWHETLRLGLSLNGINAKLNDNRLLLTLEAETPQEAEKRCHELMDWLMLNLMLSNESKYRYHYKLLSIHSDTGMEATLPLKPPMWGNYHMFYNLDELRERFLGTIYYSHIVDTRLFKAFKYYDHGIEIVDSLPNPAQISDFELFNAQLLSVSSFLNFWKAITTILGDPNPKSDGKLAYESRYKEFGIPESFFNSRIERLRSLRNEEAVAHYEVGSEGMMNVSDNLAEAQEVARVVLTNYREYLRRIQIKKSKTDIAT
jgi:hypothetical protein